MRSSRQESSDPASVRPDPMVAWPDPVAERTVSSKVSPLSSLLFMFLSFFLLLRVDPAAARPEPVAERTDPAAAWTVSVPRLSLCSCFFVGTRCKMDNSCCYGVWAWGRRTPSWTSSCCCSCCYGFKLDKFLLLWSMGVGRETTKLDKFLLLRFEAAVDTAMD